MLADMVRTLPTHEAYDLRSEVYDRDGNPPIAPEERHIDALIGESRVLFLALPLPLSDATGSPVRATALVY